MRVLPVLTVAIAATLLLAGIMIVALNDRAEASVLTKFSSENELRDFLERHAAKVTAKDNAGYATAEVSSSFSGTNVQVQGVDEGDLVKTDGSTIFVAEGSTVHLIGTVPSLHNLTDISVGNGSGENHALIQGLYLRDGSLIVVYTLYEYRPMQPYPIQGDVALMYYPYWSTQRTGVLVYDVSEPLRPSLACSGGISGGLLATRMIDQTLYVVAEQYVWDGQDVCLPEVSVNGDNETVSATAINYDPACRDVSSYVNLLAFDVTSGEVGSITALAGQASVVYMSPTSMYLTVQVWSETGAGPFSTDRYEASTHIFRVSVDGTALTLAAQGEVGGVLLNQFALDEWGDRLRVATTSSSQQPTNGVHVLDLDLKEVGSLDGIAPGERIYSSRYLDDRLYLVTFRQVDPLFVIDLRTDAPSVIGELKVPGASTYLQMVDEGLLGIGFDNSSVKVSLYNVTDPQHMVEVGSYIVDGFSASTAQYDHRAVLYDPVRSLLVIPITYYGGWTLDSWTSYRSWSSALVLSIGASGVNQVGSVLHDNATVERSLYIGDVLYTISDTTVKANSLPALSSIGEIVYSDGQQRNYGWQGAAEPLMVD